MFLSPRQDQGRPPLSGTRTQKTIRPPLSNTPIKQFDSYERGEIIQPIFQSIQNTQITYDIRKKEEVISAKGEESIKATELPSSKTAQQPFAKEADKDESNNEFQISSMSKRILSPQALLVMDSLKSLKRLENNHEKSLERLKTDFNNENSSIEHRLTEKNTSYDASNRASNSFSVLTRPKLQMQKLESEMIFNENFRLSNENGTSYGEIESHKQEVGQIMNGKIYNPEIKEEALYPIAKKNNLVSENRGVETESGRPDYKNIHMKAPVFNNINLDDQKIRAISIDSEEIEKLIVNMGSSKSNNPNLDYGEFLKDEHKQQSSGGLKHESKYKQNVRKNESKTSLGKKLLEAHSKLVEAKQNLTTKIQKTYEKLNESDIKKEESQTSQKFEEEVPRAKATQNSKMQSHSLQDIQPPKLEDSSTSPKISSSSNKQFNVKSAYKSLQEIQGPSAFPNQNTQISGSSSSYLSFHKEAENIPKVISVNENFNAESGSYGLIAASFKESQSNKFIQASKSVQGPRITPQNFSEPQKDEYDDNNPSQIFRRSELNLIVEHPYENFEESDVGRDKSIQIPDKTLQKGKPNDIQSTNQNNKETNKLENESLIEEMSNSNAYKHIYNTLDSLRKEDPSGERLVVNVYADMNNKDTAKVKGTFPTKLAKDSSVGAQYKYASPINKGAQSSNDDNSKSKRLFENRSASKNYSSQTYITKTPKPEGRIAKNQSPKGNPWKNSLSNASPSNKNYLTSPKRNYKDEEKESYSTIDYKTLRTPRSGVQSRNEDSVKNSNKKTPFESTSSFLSRNSKRMFHSSVLCNSTPNTLKSQHCESVATQNFESSQTYRTATESESDIKIKKEKNLNDIKRLEMEIQMLMGNPANETPLKSKINPEISRNIHRATNIRTQEPTISDKKVHKKHLSTDSVGKRLNFSSKKPKDDIYSEAKKYVEKYLSSSKDGISNQMNSVEIKNTTIAERSTQETEQNGSFKKGNPFKRFQMKDNLWLELRKERVQERRPGDDLKEISAGKDFASFNIVDEKKQSFTHRQGSRTPVSNEARKMQRAASAKKNALENEILNMFSNIGQHIPSEKTGPSTINSRRGKSPKTDGKIRTIPAFL